MRTGRFVVSEDGQEAAELDVFGVGVGFVHQDSDLYCSI